MTVCPEKCTIGKRHLEVWTYITLGGVGVLLPMLKHNDKRGSSEETWWGWNFRR